MKRYNHSSSNSRTLSLASAQLAQIVGGKRYTTYYDYDGDGKVDKVVTEVSSTGTTRVVKVVFGK